MIPLAFVWIWMPYIETREKYDVIAMTSLRNWNEQQMKKKNAPIRFNTAMTKWYNKNKSHRSWTKINQFSSKYRTTYLRMRQRVRLGWTENIWPWNPSPIFLICEIPCRNRRFLQTHLIFKWIIPTWIHFPAKFSYEINMWSNFQHYHSKGKIIVSNFDVRFIGFESVLQEISY